MISTFLAEAEARGASYAYAAPKQSPEWSLVNRSKVWNAAEYAENVASKASFKPFYRLVGSRRMGRTEWFANAMDKEHSSRGLTAKDDWNPASAAEPIDKEHMTGF